MKKRALALLLALSLGMSLAACGKKDPNPSQNPNNPPVETQQAEVPTEPTTVQEKLAAAASMSNDELYE
ncbi:MAG: hypothetical protein K2F83_04250, partial [Oscillospiraceae bacterium]|nr:hypothetical protein [Oscillospiraceae bacterium]